MFYALKVSRLLLSFANVFVDRHHLVGNAWPNLRNAFLFEDRQMKLGFSLLLLDWSALIFVLLLLWDLVIRNGDLILLTLKALLAGLIDLLKLSMLRSYSYFFWGAAFLLLEDYSHSLNFLLFLLKIECFVKNFIFGLCHNSPKLWSAFASFGNLLNTALLFLLEHAHPILKLLNV